VPRHLFIVSRRDRALYEYLLTRFADDDRVEVILDRRYGDRRRNSRTIGSDRRRSERRTSSHVQQELETYSHVILTYG